MNNGGIRKDAAVFSLRGERLRGKMHAERMMNVKRIFCLLAAAALCLNASGALASGLVVSEETYTAVERFEDTFYGYVFAELENTGDADVYFEQAQLTISDAAGKTRAEKTAFTCYPNVIAPGGRAFVFAYSAVEDAADTEDLSAYRLAVSGSESIEEPPVVLTVTGAEYAQETDLFGEPVYKIYVTAKNETDEAVFTPSVAFGLYDEKGELIYVDAMTQFDMGVPAGQSFIMTFTIDDAFKAAWDAQGTTPAKVEAIAIVQY